MFNVLIVDDHDQMRAALARAMRETGASVREASDGADALAQLRAAPADIVVLDLIMPGMDGHSLIREIRADQKLSTQRVLVVTGEADGVTTAKAAGADAAALKPITADKLIALIKAELGG
jgi:two-component system chemotaxis response regulator CheY